MELRNPLTTAQLEKLRPRPLVVDFAAVDVPGSKLLGTVPAGHQIPMCVVEILDAFDAGVGITVGDLVAQGRFHALADNDPQMAGHYETHPHYTYAVDTDVYVFLHGSSILGNGRVILYIQ